MKQFFVGLLVALAITLPAVGQETGIATKARVIADSLLPDSQKMSLHDVTAPTSLIAGVHLLAENREEKLNTDQFHFGPVMTAGTASTLCVLLESLDARYQGQWLYDVYSGTNGMTLRPLETKHSARLSETFRVGLVRSLGVLGDSCDSYTAETLVATSFVEVPDTLEIILAMENGFPKLRLLNEQKDEVGKLKCRLNDAPHGFRCTMSLNGVSNGEHTLEISIDYSNGGDPTVVTSNIALHTSQ